MQVVMAFVRVAHATMELRPVAVVLVLPGGTTSVAAPNAGASVVPMDGTPATARAHAQAESSRDACSHAEAVLRHAS